MGIEQYIYEKIGCPKLDIVGEVSVKIGKNEPTVTWINQDNVKTDNEFEDNRFFHMYIAQSPYRAYGTKTENAQAYYPLRHKSRQFRIHRTCHTPLHIHISHFYLQTTL